MKKADLAKMVQEEMDTTKVASEKLVQMMFDAMMKTLKKGDTVDIAGFGKFIVTKRAARMARNPRTGEAVKVAATKVPKFRPAKALKEAVK